MPYLCSKSVFIHHFNSCLGPENLTAKLMTDIEPLLPFFKDCEEFVKLVFHHNDTDLEANDFISALPNNKSQEDKLPIGIYNASGELIAAFDLIKDYPHLDSWYIGLLLIPPVFRSHKIGSSIFTCFEEAVIVFGGKEVNLIVQENNSRALLFWEKLGFTTIRESIQELPTGSNRVFHMKKCLRNL